MNGRPSGSAGPGAGRDPGSRHAPGGKFLPNRNSAVEMRPLPGMAHPMASGNPASGSTKTTNNRQHSKSISPGHPHPAALFGRPGAHPATSPSGVGGSLEKRPTFEAGLDKRKSWSVDVGAAAGLAQQSGSARAGLPMQSPTEKAPASGTPGGGQLRNARGQTLREVQQMQQSGTPGAKKGPALALNSKG